MNLLWMPFNLFHLYYCHMVHVSRFSLGLCQYLPKWLCLSCSSVIPYRAVCLYSSHIDILSITSCKSPVGVAPAGPLLGCSALMLGFVLSVWSLLIVSTSVSLTWPFHLNEPLSHLTLNTLHHFFIHLVFMWILLFL